MQPTAVSFAIKVWDDFDTSTASEARSRPPPLILFSFDLLTTRAMRFILCIVVLLLAFASCKRHRQNAMSSSGPVVKIAVFADGRLTVDGAAATIESLRASLKNTAETHGIVWYYREASQQEPPPIAMQVMQAIVEARLPVRLSTQADYSDAIGPDGKSTTP
jgi:hypothetical protein